MMGGLRRTPFLHDRDEGMKTKIVLGALLTLFVTDAAQAAPRRPADPNCFWPSQAQSFAPEGTRAVNVRLTTGAVYRFELYGKCPDIDWRRRVAIQSSAAGRVCADRDAQVITQTSLGPLHCAVRNIRKLSQAEVGALPEDARPH
jgi:hypothetical protein